MINGEENKIEVTYSNVEMEVHVLAEAGAWIFRKYKNFKVSKVAVKASLLWFTVTLLIGILKSA